MPTKRTLDTESSRLKDQYIGSWSRIRTFLTHCQCNLVFRSHWLEKLLRIVNMVAELRGKPLVAIILLTSGVDFLLFGVSVVILCSVFSSIPANITSILV